MQYYNDTNKQINFLTNVIKIDKYSRILDIGCGSGSHVKELQKISPFVYGIDLVKPQEDLPNFILGDIFSTDLPNNLDLIYLFAPFFGDKWNSNEELLAKLSKKIKKNSKIVLDLYFFNDFEIGKGYKEFNKRPEKIILSEYTREENVMYCQRTFKFQDWTERVIELRWKVFLKDEFEKIANENGFAVVDLYFDFDISIKGSWELQNTKHRRIVVLQKI